MDVSIIICTHNRADLLNATLESLNKMHMPDDCSVEIIVVDNRCSDRTPDVINDFAGTCTGIKVRSLYETELGKVYALNSAIRNSSFDILAFIDDDHIVDTGYLKAVQQALNEYPEYNIYCGRVLPAWDGTEPQWVHDDSQYPIRPYPIPKFDLGSRSTDVRGDSFLPGSGNLVLHRKVLDREGSFRAGFGPVGHNLQGGEDMDLVIRILKSGERILYFPSMVQYHHVDCSRLKLTYLLRKSYYRTRVARELRGVPLEKKLGAVPRYLYRQAAERLMKSIFTFDSNRRRYYLVRLAATLGEVQGYRKKERLESVEKLANGQKT